MQVVGLEASTSAVKAIRYHVDQGLLEESIQAYPERSSTGTKLDPEDVFQLSLNVLRKVIEKREEPVKAIGLSGTWHSLLYLDRDLHPVGSIRTWMDTTGRAYVNETWNNVDWLKNEYYQKTGCLPHAMYPFWKHCYFRKEDRFTGGPPPILSSQIEYLFLQLTGERMVSKCTASGSGFFNIHELDWDSDLLSFASVEQEQLGTLVEETYTASLKNSIAEEVGISSSVPVCAGGADGALHQLGAGGTQEEVISCSVGTSGAIRMAVPEPLLPGERGTWCYYLHDDSRIAGGATHGTNCVDWFFDLLYEGGVDRESTESREQVYERFGKRKEQVEKADAPYFLPFLYGERGPGWNEEQRGVLANLSGEHGPGALYYGILEGILFSLFDCFRILVEEKETANHRMVLSGGILNDEGWVQMVANLFDREVYTTGYVNDSTVGAALLALQAAGEIEDVNETLPELRVLANPSGRDHVSRFEARYETYRTLYSLHHQSRVK